MSKLRVLLVAQPTAGGVGACVAQLAAAGVRSGIDVGVACPQEGSLAASVMADGARWIPLEMERSPGPRDVAHVTALRRHVRAFDVVHLHSSKAGAVGRAAIRSLRRDAPPSVFTPHGWSWQAGGPLAPAYRALERALARWTDVIVAVSEADLSAGRAVLGDRCAMEVIENGIDTAWFSPEGELADRSDEPLVVCVGRLAYPKGQADAIRALARLADRSVRLRLVGDGPDRPTLEGLIDALGLNHRVELVGESKDPAPHLRAADVVVVPSHFEAMSLVMLEAMACGRPVVSTAVAGSAALTGAGVVVPVGDPGAMARALDDLLRRPDRRRDLGAAARQAAVSRFRMERSTEHHVRLWHRLAARDRS